MARRTKGLTPLPSGNVRARYQHKGRTYYKTFPNMEQARAWRSKELTLIHDDVWTPPAEREGRKKRTGLTVAEYFETLPTKRNWEPTTERGYRSMFTNDIAPTFGEMHLAAITRAEVRKWYDGMVKANKDRKKRNRDVYSLLKTIFSQAVEDELVQVSPVNIPGASTRPSAKKEQEIPTAQEFAKLVAAVPERYRVPTMVAAVCALRIGEWAELRRKDVRRDSATGVMKVHVCRQVREAKGKSGKVVVPFTKTKQDRWVTVPAAIVPALEQHIGTYAGAGRDGLLFPNKEGDWVDRRRFNRMLKAACHEALGHDNIHSHILRHYGGTQFAMAGGTMAETMARLGHTTTSAALRYQHAAEVRDVEVANRMVMPLVAVPDVA